MVPFWYLFFCAVVVCGGFGRDKNQSFCAVVGWGVLWWVQSKVPSSAEKVAYFIGATAKYGTNMVPFLFSSNKKAPGIIRGQKGRET